MSSNDPSADSPLELFMQSRAYQNYKNAIKPAVHRAYIDACTHRLSETDRLFVLYDAVINIVRAIEATAARRQDGRDETAARGRVDPNAIQIRGDSEDDGGPPAPEEPSASARVHPSIFDNQEMILANYSEFVAARRSNGGSGLTPNSQQPDISPRSSPTNSHSSVEDPESLFPYPPINNNGSGSSSSIVNLTNPFIGTGTPRHVAPPAPSHVLGTSPMTDLTNPSIGTGTPRHVAPPAPSHVLGTSHMTDLTNPSIGTGTPRHVAPPAPSDTDTRRRRSRKRPSDMPAWVLEQANAIREQDRRSEASKRGRTS
ncbi:Nn.00g096480.m01.CDS01 [Neocucurbitaria sp. VM-36]